MNRVPIKFRRPTSRRGVALLFFLMVIGVLMAFLMMIINTGMIVHQKIRLQSAVDLAAYAGASVQAAYLGDEMSFENAQSLAGLNREIMAEYEELMRRLNNGEPNRVGAMPIPLPRGACEAFCLAQNNNISERALEIYNEHRDRILQKHAKARRILQQLPEKVREAAEATLALNIPELSIDSRSGDMSATNDVQRAMSQVRGGQQEKENVALTFQSEMGAYLANVVTDVYYTRAIYGPACVPISFSCADPSFFWGYCPINSGGQTLVQECGSPPPGLAQSVYTWGLAQSGEAPGFLDVIEDALPLQLIENPHKPKPFTVVAAEWFPENGSFINMENSLGATGSLFPKQTRLAAVAAAEPFGSTLARFDRAFGVRLAGIRKLLLDPRVQPVKDDYGDLFPYMESLAPSYAPNESAEDVIQRFLH